MTIRELIEKLQEFPWDMDVIVEIEPFMFADVTAVTEFEDAVVLMV